MNLSGIKLQYVIDSYSTVLYLLVKHFILLRKKQNYIMIMDTPLHPKVIVECSSKINILKVKLFSDKIIVYLLL